MTPEFFILITINICTLWIILHIIKPKNFTLSIIHFFIIFGILWRIIGIVTNYDNTQFKIEEDGDLLIFVHIVQSLIIITLAASFIGINYNLLEKSTYDNLTYSTLGILAIIFFILQITRYFFPINIEKLLFPFYGFIYNCALLVPAIGLYYFNKFSSKNRLLALVTTALYFGSVILSGSRGILIIPIIFIVFYCLNFKFKNKALILIALIFLYSPFHSLYTNLRLLDKTGSSGSIISQILESDSEEKYDGSFFSEDLKWRFNVYNWMSIAALNVVKEESPVGFRPIISSILSIIPKTIIPFEKDWPGSADGTQFGILSHKAYGLATGEFWNMAEFAPFIVPLWELGWAYMLFGVVINILWLSLLVRLCVLVGDKFNLLFLSALLPFTYMQFEIPVINILQTFSYVTFPGILLILTFTKLNKFNIIKRDK
jgi:hypothetical protein